MMIVLRFLLLVAGNTGAQSATAEELVRQLGDDKPSVRESAAKRLEELGRGALNALKGAAATSTDSEVRERAMRILERIERRWAQLPISLPGREQKDTRHFRSVSFVDSSAGWIADGGSVLRTLDGGKTWETQLSTTAEQRPRKDGDLSKVWFQNRENGWAIGGMYGDEEIYPAVYMRTCDGGKTWERPKWSEAMGTYYDIHFFDRSGWMCRHVQDQKGTLVKTSDRGATWAIVEIPSAGRFEFVSEEVVFGLSRSSDSYVVKTQNGGQTWTTFNLKDQESLRDLSLNLSSTSFISAKEGWLAAEDMKDREEGCNVILLHTGDGCKTWDLRGLQNLKRVGYPTRIKFLDAARGWILTSAKPLNKILATDDGGRTWRVEASEEAIQDICFTDDGHGFAVGPKGLLLKRKSE